MVVVVVVVVVVAVVVVDDDDLRILGTVIDMTNSPYYGKGRCQWW